MAVCDVHIHPTSDWKLAVSNKSHILSLVQVGLQTFKQKPYVAVATFPTQEFVSSENTNRGQETASEYLLCPVWNIGQPTLLDQAQTIQKHLGRNATS